ncbi:MAG: zinc-ribbon domain-containing protein [Thermoproteota archaeon]
MVYCTKCGFKNENDAEFCAKCGASLDTSSANRRYRVVSGGLEGQERGQNHRFIELSIAIGILRGGPNRFLYYFIFWNSGLAFF